MRILLAVITTFLFSGVLFAQPPQGGGNFKICQISGKVLDTTSKEVVEYASVALLKAQDSSVVDGTISNAKGEFLLKELSPGKYLIRVSFVGFKNKFVGPFTLKPQQGKGCEFDLGNIYLKSNEMLDEFEVVEHKPFVINAVDKKIYDPDNIGAAQGRDALAVLENLPSVEVDIDGGISLRGNQNVTILIDGRPSMLSGTDPATALRSIPANSIERVEVINNPSAKYDPDGTAGIINIVLKKNKTRNFSGTISSSSGTGNKQNTSLNLSMRNDKVNIYGGYSFNYRESYRYGYSLRNAFFPTFEETLRQESFSQDTRRDHFARFGVDWYLKPKTTLSVFANYGFGFNSDFDDNRYFFSGTNLVSDSIFTRSSAAGENSNNLSTGIDFKKEYKSLDHFISSSLSFSTNERDDKNSIYQYAPDDFIDYLMPNERINTLNGNSNFSHTFDYSNPITDSIKIEAGTKINYREINNSLNALLLSNGSYINDIGRTNSFSFNEQVYAAYGIFTHKVSKFGYSVGLRAEQAVVNSKLENTGETFNNPYFSLFPSASMIYEFKDSKSLKLNYSRRISRPNLWSLNPFPSYTDPLNIREGNPYLKPAYTNSMEMEYSVFQQKYTFSSTAFFRHTTDMVTRLRSLRPDGVAVMTFANLNTGMDYGLELLATYRHSKWLSLMVSGNLTQSQIATSGDVFILNNSYLSGSTRFSADVRIKNFIDFQASGNYTPARNTAQGYMYEFVSFNLTAKRMILKNKGTLSVSYNDLFNNMRFEFENEGFNFNQTMHRKRETRIVYLNFSYVFGKSEDFRPSKRRGGSGGGEGGGMDMFD
jgi:iron complex outermembrane recepter protein